ncbi:MAG: 23S rRNA (uracil(1939)-C(5))-methyltransferase RlmD [Bacteroidales bacterium]|jgi:23S rRNA (uracil1939-C5)-methyltransferase|nr:23S rRNA (uracil(1939)-C(5))-methyltransferase RlmD [Bacteroidales bacterium]MCI2122507.1 23S rRNA (uracil(1939)-C(5))-methyltransferase RlmD [Bacteroidales bacterium]MCI2144788.1 23S rRNA (uracil(1939)-C(5))-methyltransferase RlmD [Bacteroidales bacterium]
MGRRNKPLINNVLIESVAAEGNGLAHVDGKVLFVRTAVPGDLVDVQVSKVRKAYDEGYITRIVKPSPTRLKPFCEHFGSCGGCTWQVLPYSDQIAFKQRQVEDQLVRIGHLDIPPVLPIIPSDNTVFYRNKLEFAFSNHRWIDKEENPDGIAPDDWLALGFHVSGFFDKVQDIRKCWLQKDPSNAIRLFVKKYCIEHHYTFFDLKAQTGLMRLLVIRTSSTGEVMVTLVFNYDDEPKRKALLDALMAGFPEITSLYYVINGKPNDNFSDLPCVLYNGNACIYEQMENLRFRISPKSFYQTNSEQACKLYSVVRNYVKSAMANSCISNDKPVIYDLYTGTGTIALFLSSLASKVVGIEYVRDAIDDAVLNAELNGVSNCEFVAGDMKDVLTPDFISAHGRPDIVVLDPPRAGIHPAVAGVLMETAPEHMVYVSCNPASQARDLAVFAEKYEILAVQPVDMFPHTVHVENVCFLRLKKPVEQA